MDNHTLQVLDFPRIREILTDLAQTDLGRKAAQEMKLGLARPAVEHEFNLTGELLTESEEPALSGVTDIEALLAGGPTAGVLTAQELLQIRATLDRLETVHKYLNKRRERLPLIAQECSAIRGFNHLVIAIDEVLTETGEIKDDASPELNRIRIRLRRLRKELMREMEDTP